MPEEDLALEFEEVLEEDEEQSEDGARTPAELNQERYFFDDAKKVCQRCKKVGHTRAACIESLVICHYCLGSHTKKDCQASCCYNCGDPSHDKKDCRVTRPTCNRCRKRGHGMRECGFLLSKESFMLDEIDDIFRDRESNVKCELCGEYEHYLCFPKGKFHSKQKAIEFLKSDGLFSERYRKKLQLVLKTDWETELKKSPPINEHAVNNAIFAPNAENDEEESEGEYKTGKREWNDNDDDYDPVDDEDHLRRNFQKMNLSSGQFEQTRKDHSERHPNDRRHDNSGQNTGFDNHRQHYPEKHKNHDYYANKDYQTRQMDLQYSKDYELERGRQNEDSRQFGRVQTEATYHVPSKHKTKSSRNQNEKLKREQAKNADYDDEAEYEERRSNEESQHQKSTKNRNPDSDISQFGNFVKSLKNCLSNEQINAAMSSGPGTGYSNKTAAARPINPENDPFGKYRAPIPGQQMQSQKPAILTADDRYGGSYQLPTGPSSQKYSGNDKKAKRSDNDTFAGENVAGGGIFFLKTPKDKIDTYEKKPRKNVKKLANAEKYRDRIIKKLSGSGIDTIDFDDK